jgi:hypothetical protein
MAKARTEDVHGTARSYIDEALKIQTRFGQASEASEDDYAKALADAEEAFGHLAHVRRLSGKGSRAAKQVA